MSVSTLPATPSSARNASRLVDFSQFQLTWMSRIVAEEFQFLLVCNLEQGFLYSTSSFTDSLVLYPGYQWFFSRAAGIFDAGRRPTHLEPQAEATSGEAARKNPLFCLSLNLSTPSKTLLVHCFLCFSSMPFQNFLKPPSQHNASCRYTYVMSTAQLEIFFHVLVYSCQPIVASVRFKVRLSVSKSVFKVRLEPISRRVQNLDQLI